MPDIKKTLTLDKADYFETHLSIINCVLPKTMTPMEIKVIASFMSLEGDIARYRFSSVGKKIVMGRLGISASGLSNYMGALTKKGFLLENGNDRDLEIRPILIPEREEQVYMFKLKNKDELTLQP